LAPPIALAPEPAVWSDPNRWRRTPPAAFDLTVTPDD
jgi:hypothetical protein